MGVLLPPEDSSGLMPAMPGAGIVPAPAPQYTFTQPAALAVPQAAPEEQKTKYSIMSRLLGDAHRDQVASKQALVNFYSQNIHSAYNDPENRTPPEVLVTWGNELGKLLGHPEAAKAIKADVQRHIASRDAQNKLGYVNKTQDQNQQGMGVPAVPAAPAQPSQPAFTPGQRAVEALRQQGQPPGLPQPPAGAGGPAPVPFDQGELDGSPAPLENVPAAIKAGGDTRGAGFVQPPATQYGPGLSPGIISRGQRFMELEGPKTDLAIKLQQAFIDQGTKMGLTGAMLADYVNKHSITAGKILNPGDVYVDANGKLLARGANRLTNQSPGSTTLETPTAVPGLPAMPGSENGQPIVHKGPPMLRSETTRDAIDAYTAERKTQDPNYTFSDKDLNAALAAHRAITAPIGERAEAAYMKGLEGQLGRKLTDRELSNAHVTYQGMLAEGKETASVQAMRSVAAELARARLDEIKDRTSPEGLDAAVKAWQLGIPPRNSRDADAAARYAIAHDMEVPIPLSGAAQRVLQETQPVLDNIQRIKAELEPLKNSSTPAATLLPRIAYALGYGTDQSKLLSDLEMGRIVQGARIIKGSSKAAPVLEKAMIHTPNAWKDSGKLMYDKLSRIEQTLQDQIHATKMYGLKSGIVTTKLPEPPEQAASSGKAYAFKGSKGNMLRVEVPPADVKDFLAAHPDAKETK
jgi:hypothetical protein